MNAKPVGRFLATAILGASALCSIQSTAGKKPHAAMALAARDNVPLPALITMLDDPKPEVRLGACQALAQMKGEAAPAVPALRKTLHSGDLWLRVKAADALCAIGEAAAPAVPELLEMIARGPTPEDPRNMQQRFFIFALFNAKNGGLGDMLKKQDRDALFKAVRAGLQNEDGRARGSFVSVYQLLSYEEIKPLLPAVLEAVRKPAPSGIMFADQIRIEGLKVLAKHRIAEAMPACIEYLRTQNRWSSQKRSVELMAILGQYGIHAQAHIPELEAIAAKFAKGEGDFPRKATEEKVKVIREGILAIKATKDEPKLESIRLE